MNRILFFALLIFCVSSCRRKREPEIPNTVRYISHPEWKKFYDEAKVEGDFILLDYNNTSWHMLDSELFSPAYYVPASTFKIPNSLIALESGAVRSEHDTLKWDGVKRWNEAWNADTDLEGAYKNSTVWFYQQCARRAGGKVMKSFLDKMHYGNADTSGGVDRFWLEKGGLRISPLQQVCFLAKLYENRVPFSQKNVDAVKKIMIQEQTPDYTLRAKTGWAFYPSHQTGWYVGYLERGNNAYVFANCITTKDTALANFAGARKEITKKILKELKLLE